VIAVGVIKFAAQIMIPNKIIRTQWTLQMHWAVIVSKLILQLKKISLRKANNIKQKQYEKKIILNLGILLTICIIMPGCIAFHSGYLQSSAALSSANFSYLYNIQGKAKATYVFGIGGLSRATLVDEAKQDMLSSSPLKSNQALANTTVNFKNSNILGFIMIVRCTVTADVVQFNK